MQPRQIGGGELAQVAWFELSSLGVKNPKIMSSMINLIGKSIKDSAKTDKLIDSLYKEIIDKQPELKQPGFKDNITIIFNTAKSSIEQFISTNIPNLSLSSDFELSFNGSSLLVSISV